MLRPMPRNIEIKARVRDMAALRQRARALADADAVLITQDDTFFAVPHGRLKLRRFADGSAELIHYQRPDRHDAKASDYVRVPVADAAALRQALLRANGLLGRVRKTRWLLMRGRTRIHLDRVEALGDFMELEVVLRDGEPDADGIAEAQSLMHELGLADAEQLAGAYLDMLRAGDAAVA
jgi:predicted adenylyl cyclase CyaB